MRHTDVTRRQMEQIQRLTGAKTTAEVIQNALDLYAAYLTLPPGMPCTATGHTLSDKSSAPRRTRSDAHRRDATP